MSLLRSEPLSSSPSQPTVTIIITITTNCHNHHHSYHHLSQSSSPSPPTVTIVCLVEWAIDSIFRLAIDQWSGVIKQQNTSSTDVAPNKKRQQVVNASSACWLIWKTIQEKIPKMGRKRNPRKWKWVQMCCLMSSSSPHLRYDDSRKRPHTFYARMLSEKIGFSQSEHANELNEEHQPRSAILSTTTSPSTWSTCFKSVGH